MDKKDYYNFTHFNKSKAILFAVSVVAFFALIVVAPAWCWVALPFLCTYFVEMFGWLE